MIDAEKITWAETWGEDDGWHRHPKRNDLPFPEMKDAYDAAYRRGEERRRAAGP
jgi:hypothetical protein